MVVYVAYMLISGRSSVYGLVYRESRSIRWHFGGLNKVNGKWACELGQHSSLIGAFWSRYWAEKHYSQRWAIQHRTPKPGFASTFLVKSRRS